MRLYRENHPFQACCEAGNGVAALKKAGALVILDLSIPMDGVETASALYRTVRSTKIIGLAMFAGEIPRTLIAAAGFDMILSKHEGLAKLSEAIHALLAAPDPLNS